MSRQTHRPEDPDLVEDGPDTETAYDPEQLTG